MLDVCTGEIVKPLSGFFEFPRTVVCSCSSGLAYRLATVILWNSPSLPPDIQSSASLADFCHRLKTYSFRQSFPQTFIRNYRHIDFAFTDFVMTLVILATLKTFRFYLFRCKQDVCIFCIFPYKWVSYGFQSVVEFHA